MARNIPFYCWITALISLTFLNHASCSAGNLTRLTCNREPAARIKGVPSQADEVCKQYIDGDYFHTYSKEDCNGGKSLNCCDGVCNCCDGANCTNDTCYALKISDGCVAWGDAPAVRGRCSAPARGNAVKNYSEDDCPTASRYLNCCDGECICCRVRDERPDMYSRSYTECESPARYGEASGAPKQNVTITV